MMCVCDSSVNLKLNLRNIVDGRKNEFFIHHSYLINNNNFRKEKIFTLKLFWLPLLLNWILSFSFFLYSIDEFD